MLRDPMRVRSTTTHCLQLAALVFSAACGSDDTETPATIDPAIGTSGASGSAPVAGTAAGSAGTRSTTVGPGAGAPAAGITGGSAGASTAGAAGAAAAGSGTAGAVAAGSGAAAGAGGSAEAPTAGAAGGGDTTPEVACDPADMLPEAMAVTGVGMGMPPAGKFPTAVEVDPGLPEMTVFRPETLGEIKHPVLAWGNGGCVRANSGFSEFLLQLAAEGVVVIADGSPATARSASANQNGEDLIEAIDWAEKENERPCSKYYHKLDLKAIAVSGQSCGGLMALNASDDPRVTMSMPMNSGLLSRNQTLYAALHAPMAIINGGSSDMAYANGNADFEAITNIPIMVANIDVGHGGTYREDNGGEMGKFALAWVRWHLLKDEGATGKGMFIGDSCGFCNTEWEMMWKMKPM